MRRKSGKAGWRRFLKNEDGPHLDVSSLVDVCFLLLVFFLVTSVITKKEQDLDMKLPTRYENIESVVDPLLLTLKNDGKV